MYDTILVPTDGSDGTERTMEHAAEIGRDHDSTVHGLYVVNKRLYIATNKDRREDVIADLRREGEEAVEAVADRAEAAGLDAVTAIRDGIPHRAILDYADERDVDLVVMGTHGKTGRDRIVSLGSVAERVVGNARAPVLTVRIDGDDHSSADAT